LAIELTYFLKMQRQFEPSVAFNKNRFLRSVALRFVGVEWQMPISIVEDDNRRGEHVAAGYPRAQTL
jgi:hypothetical protein